MAYWQGFSNQRHGDDPLLLLVGLAWHNAQEMVCKGFSVAGNTAKYESYKAAFERIDAGIEKEAPIEVVALCESIISDRLLSFVCGIGADKSADTRTGL